MSSLFSADFVPKSRTSLYGLRLIDTRMSLGASLVVLEQRLDDEGECQCGVSWVIKCILKEENRVVAWPSQWAVACSGMSSSPRNLP